MLSCLHQDYIGALLARVAFLAGVGVKDLSLSPPPYHRYRRRYVYVLLVLCRPPAVMAVYNVFSLVNFNFELLAPECSLSLDFETKWCADATTPTLKKCNGRGGELAALLRVQLRALA